MNEASILQSLFDGIDAVLAVFSTFFAIVSVYATGFYFFLARAPLLLKSVAFSMRSIGLVFLGGTVTVIQKLQEGLFAAWGYLERPILPLHDLRNLIPGLHVAGFTQQEIGVGIGWTVVVAAVYLALFYLTFLYRWPDEAPRGKHLV